MAIISERLQIVDGFSAVFSKFTELGDKAAQTFERISGSASRFEQSQSKVADSAGKSAESLGRSAKAGEDHASKMQKATTVNNIASNSFDKLAASVKRVVIALGGIEAIKALIKLSDQLSMIQARINSIDVGHVSENMQMIYQAAQRAGGKFLDMADAIAKIKIRAPEAFSSLPQATRFMEILNKQFALSGTDAEGVASTMYNLTQALSLGVLRGNDLKYVMSNLPELGQLLAKEMGVSVGEVKKLAETGQITAEVVKNAVLTAGKDIDIAFENMPMTFGRAMNKVVNAGIYNFQKLQKVINKAINSEEFIAAMNATAIAINTVINVGVIGFEKMGEAIRISKDILSEYSPIVYGLVAAFTVYHGLMVANTAITMACAAAEGIHTAAMIVATGAKTAFALATAAATGNMIAFNAALQACPIVWIIDAIAVIIGAIIALIVLLHKLAQTGHTIIGDVVGFVYGALNFVQNLFLIFFNSVIDGAETVANNFWDAIYSIQTGFYNLASMAIDGFNSMIDGADKAATAIANAFISGANAALDGINGIIEGLNNIPGVSIGKVGKVGSIGSVISGRIDKSGLTAPTRHEIVTLDRFETTGLGESFQQGFEKGSAIGDEMQGDLMESIKKLTSGLTDLSGGDNGDLSNLINSNDNLANAMGGGAGGSGGKTNVGTVDKVKDVTLSDEDLKIYRDLAERKYMARLELKQLAPNITVNIPEGQAQLLTPGDIVDKLKVMLIEQMSNHTALNYNI